MPPIRWLERYLARLEYPQLLILALTLLGIDLLVPDPLPFLDEALLLVVSTALALWKKGGASGSAPGREKPPEKDVTPGA